MTAPPGTPGAATIAKAREKMNWEEREKLGSIPERSITAVEHIVIVVILPPMWILAHSGATKSAIFAFTPFVCMASMLTGIVAAEDWVPRAVKYAGSIFFKRAKGPFFTKEPAIVNSMIRIQIWKVIYVN